MVENAGSVALRIMRDSGVPEVVAIQEPASVVGLASVFPQDEFPFPRQDVARRWREEIAEAGTDCFVVLERDAVVGFAAIRGDELLHFGIAIERCGSGIAPTDPRRDHRRDASSWDLSCLAEGLHRERPRPCVLREARLAPHRGTHPQHLRTKSRTPPVRARHRAAKGNRGRSLSRRMVSRVRSGRPRAAPSAAGRSRGEDRARRIDIGPRPCGQADPRYRRDRRACPRPRRGEGARQHRIQAPW